MKSIHVKLSKFLSLVLRHHPETIGLALDENGWADVPELLAKMNSAGRKIDRETLQEVVTTNDKQRFSFSENGSRIRANQGHSVRVDLALEPQIPPDRLLHGTAERHLKAILREGLMPGSRQQVHLSLDAVTATKVGMRHGKPAILEIDARSMQEAGHSFFLSENGVWLTDTVPPAYLRPFSSD